MTAEKWVKSKYPAAFCKTIRRGGAREYQVLDGETEIALGTVQNRPYNAWSSARRALKPCPAVAAVKDGEAVKVAIIFYKKEIEGAGGIGALRDKIRGLVGR